MDDPAKKAKMNAEEDNYPLRKSLLDDDYMASCLAITLTKLAIKAKKCLSKVANQLTVDALLILCAMLKAKKKAD